MKRLPLLLVALLLLAAPAAADEVWEKQLGEEITAVATDERGDRIFVGTESGMLYCYDRGGNVVWSKTLSSPPLKLESSAGGEYVVVGYGNRAELCDGASGSAISQRPSSDPQRVWIAPNTGAFVYLESGNYYIRVCDSSGRAWWFSPHLGHAISDVAISGDASWVSYASGSDLRLYTLEIPDPGSWLPWVSGRCLHNRVAHTITGSSDGALTDYPIEIKVVRGTGTSSGNTLYAPDCRADFNDIRFTASDGTTKLSYYLESVSGNTATFYVKIPEIPASPSTETIYIYWGDAYMSSSESDPDALYDIYDDFSGTSLNTDIWETFGSATITVADGKLTISGDNIGYSGVRSKSVYTGDNDVLEVRASVEGDLGSNGAFWIGYFGDGQVPNSQEYELSATLKRATFTSWNHEQQLHGSTADGSARANYLFGNRLTGYNDYRIKWDGASANMQAGPYGEQTLGSAPTTDCTIILAIGDVRASYGGVTMTVDKVTHASRANIPGLHGAWGPVESIVTPLDTKTLDGTIVDIDAPETGDWVAVSTTTKTYIIEVTPTGFGTVYSADRTGTPYDVAIANNGANVIEGRGILADIFRFDGVQTGTYTAGGPVRTVAIAQKNGLYAAAGSDDGKYYVFSKDASSSWYLLHASDSASPVTALAMSWRGETLVVGRSDGHLVAFQPAVEEEEFPGTIRLLVYKDALPYTGAQLVIEHGGTDQTWGTTTTIITDDYGVATAQVRWGEYVRVTVGENELQRVILPNPQQTEYVFRIKGPDPLRTGAQYSSDYDPDTRRIYLRYDDTRGKTHLVQYQIIRSVDNAVVFQREYSTLPVNDYYQIPAGWTNTSYRVQLTASGSPSFTNTWSQWVGTDGVASLPADLDTYARMGIAFFLILFVAGLFSYLSGPQGAVVVSLFAGALVLWGWLPLPPTVIALCIVWAFLGLLGRTSGE